MKRPLICGIASLIALGGWTEENQTAYWCALEAESAWSDPAWSLTTEPESSEELVPFTSGWNAVFGAIDDDSLPRDAVVDADVTAGDVTFKAGDHLLTGPGTLTAANLIKEAGGTASIKNGGLALADGGAINVAGGAIISNAAPFTGTVPWVKTGAGTLYLSGASSAYNPSSPLVIRGGLVKLANGVPSVLGAYTGGATRFVTIEDDGTLDLNGFYTASYPLYATIAGAGHDNEGALIDTGMKEYNKYISQITLADDATVKASGQMYVTKIVSNGHTMTKRGGTQFCLQNLDGDGDLRLQQGPFTVFSNSGLGNTVGKTIIDGGQVAFWEGNWTSSEPFLVTASGSLHISGGSANTRKMTLAGPIEIQPGKTLTLSGQNVTYMWELQSNVSGAGTLQLGSNYRTNYLTASTFTFPGTLSLPGDRILYVGYRGQTAGTLGTGGRLSNGGSVIFLRDGEISFSRNVSGGGTMYVVASNKVVVNSASFTNSVKVFQGELTFDGVKGQIPSTLAVGVAKSWPAEKLMHATGVVNVQGDTDLQVAAFQMGNADQPDGPLTGIVNQVSGRITVTGAAAENCALHLGHWPKARTTYNMRGGELIVKTDYRLGVAVDGQGWFNLSGGSVYVPEFNLNIRDDTAGKGFLDMTGGRLYLGPRGLVAGRTAPYEATLRGGTIHCWNTNSIIAVNATLGGTNEATATTFDTADRQMIVGGVLSGAGGFNKDGSGTLLITNACKYAGVGRIRAGLATFGADAGSVTGTLETAANACIDLAGRTMTTGRFAGAGALVHGTIGAGATIEGGAAGGGTLSVSNSVTVATGATLGVSVTEDGGCGLIDFVQDGALALGRVKVTVSNPSLLDPKKKYTFAQCAKGLTAEIDPSALPDGWHVLNRKTTLVLDGNNGTVVLFR